MIGFKNPTHQGWKMARIHTGEKAVRACPYPPGSEAMKEYGLGMLRAAHQQTWDGRPL
jgi:hypothetical protein